MIDPDIETTCPRCQVQHAIFCCPCASQKHPVVVGGVRCECGMNLSRLANESNEVLVNRWNSIQRQAWELRAQGMETGIELMIEAGLSLTTSKKHIQKRLIEHTSGTDLT